MCLARDAKGVEREKWREIGEKCVEEMSTVAKLSAWNFENKSLLLQAMLHQANSRHTMTELVYKAAINSAGEHRFIREEALAHEHFGLYLIDNGQLGRGMEHLRMAMEKYSQWGGSKKAYDVKEMMGVIRQP